MDSILQVTDLLKPKAYVIKALIFCQLCISFILEIFIMYSCCQTANNLRDTQRLNQQLVKVCKIVNCLQIISPIKVPPMQTFLWRQKMKGNPISQKLQQITVFNIHPLRQVAFQTFKPSPFEEMKICSFELPLPWITYEWDCRLKIHLLSDTGLNFESGKEQAWILILRNLRLLFHQNWSAFHIKPHQCC